MGDSFTSLARETTGLPPHVLEWVGLSSNKCALYFTSKMAKKSPSEKLPLDLQECEHVNPKTGLVECLTALVLSFVNYKSSIFKAVF